VPAKSCGLGGGQDKHRVFHCLSLPLREGRFEACIEVFGGHPTYQFGSMGDGLLEHRRSLGRR
jgi:hypothetical protein